MSKTEKLARRMARKHFNTNRKAQGKPLCRTISPDVWDKVGSTWIRAAETEMETATIMRGIRILKKKKAENHELALKQRELFLQGSR
jgi:hypothetical protein